MRVCVFGSSSPKTSQRILDCAFELGELIASRGFICVNGGGSSGVMGAVNRGARSLGGEIIGVIHEKWCVDGQEDHMITNMIIVGGDDLEDRKKLLIENGDCIMALPGGVGTYDEIWDAVCGKSLGMKGMEHKAICLVNVDGYFDGFIVQMQRSHEEGLLYGSVDKFFYVAADVQAGLNWCADQYIEKKEHLCSQRENRSVNVSCKSSRMVLKVDADLVPKIPEVGHNILERDNEINFDSEISEKGMSEKSEKSYCTARQTEEVSPMREERSLDHEQNFHPIPSNFRSNLHYFSVLGFGILFGIVLTKFVEKRNKD